MAYAEEIGRQIEAAAAENSGESPVLDRVALARAVVSNDAGKAFTDLVGGELTESNLEMVDAKMKSALRHDIDDETEPRPDLNRSERQQYAALQAVLKSVNAALFVLEEISPWQVFKKQRTGWCRKDVTTAKYRPFGRLVVDLGGGMTPWLSRGRPRDARKP